MENSISHVNWIEKNEVVDRLLMQEGILTTHSMDQGLEAEVMKISLDKEDFVLKVWNKSSKPDIRFQFGLLKTLFKRGLKVSKPLGWGSDPNGNDVLLTTFDGTPVIKVNNKNMTALAKILSSIHQAPVEEICSIQLPQHDFIDYFFPRVREHTDIYHVLISLIQITEIKQERMIHGDFHLENILDNHGRYTVIDWTNGQLGDPRYDLAWSLILKKIYVSARYADVFLSAYLSENDIQQKELEIFEALACLRWLLLHRSGGTPKRSNTIERVKDLLTNNLFLKEFECTF